MLLPLWLILYKLCYGFKFSKEFQRGIHQDKRQETPVRVRLSSLAR